VDEFSFACASWWPGTALLLLLPAMSSWIARPGWCRSTVRSRSFLLGGGAYLATGRREGSMRAFRAEPQWRPNIPAMAKMGQYSTDMYQDGARQRIRRGIALGPDGA